MEQTDIVTALGHAYQERGIPADQLPYTEDFEDLYTDVLRRTGSMVSRAEFWRILANARNCGGLPRLRR